MVEYLKGKKALVVVAHPDDEVLGVGGTINYLTNRSGVEANAMILGEGITSRGSERDTEAWKQELELHRKNIQEAGGLIGYKNVETHNFPDNRFDGVELLDIVKVIEAAKEEFQPEVIFTHHGGDTNIDHQRTFDAVITATRPMKDEMVQTIFTFETPSSTEWQAFNHPNYFRPNFFFGIEERNVQAKIRGMESYQNEKRPFPHPRSPEALKGLAQKRGVEVGKSYAEAFMMIRSIEGA